MNTIFYSNQYGISSDDLKNHLGYINEINALTLQDISLQQSGYGRYKVKVDLLIDGEPKKYSVTTTNTELTDAWKSGQEMYEDGECGFEDWSDVVESMLILIDIEDIIFEFLQQN